MQTHPRKMMLIINPISGTGDKSGVADAIVDNLGADGIEVDVAYTRCRGDATTLARQGVDLRYDAVLACGGDGTVNETARALADTGVAMGIIPSGSGNGLARHLSIPVDVMLSLDIIKKGHFEDCDYGTVNGKPFFCTFGIGFDAAVSDRFAASGQRGKLSYIKSAFEEVIKYRAGHYELHVDGRKITDDAFLVACCNASQYGNNVYIAPQASVTDGFLDLIIVRNTSLIGKAMVGVDMISGMVPNNRFIETMQFRNAVIMRRDPGPAHLDGEPCTLGERLEVCCHPNGLRILTPAERPAFRPVITPVEDMLRDITIAIRHFLEQPI